MKIPDYVANIIKELEQAGYEAYIVGGCVRDLLMIRLAAIPLSGSDHANAKRKEPKDWDITTNARPEEILKIFPDGKYENKFGTVLVPAGQKADNRQQTAELKIISKKLSINKKSKGEAIKIAKKYLNKIKCPSHGPQHTINVVNNAIEIAKEFESANLDIIEIIAYFHDVGRVKYNDMQHIAESQRIANKELNKIFNKKVAGVIHDLIDHDFELPIKSLEQQILREADLIDVINPERCKASIKINLTEHLEWIKNEKGYRKYYDKFLTKTGKRLLNKSIKKFNQEKFGFKLPEFSGKTKNMAEVTTYRSEQGYSDRRHPDTIVFEKELDKDLARRDFTVNALAMKSTKSQIPIPKQISNFKFQISNFYVIDLFGGQKDIKKKIIRAVGEPVDRFKEDALRMMRAVRLACELGFSIEAKTERAIKKMAGGLKFISNERTKDELVKIIESAKAYEGMMKLHELKLLQYIIPELLLGEKCKQDRHHVYTVFKHSMLSLKFCPSKDWRVRFAALLHDIGKPKTKVIRGGVATFYNHEYVSAKMALKIMRRLKFSNEDMKKVENLVRYHMFYYNVDEVTASSVRRLIAKAGKENLKDLIKVRIADRLGSGTPKAKPYKLRHLEYMMKKVQNDPVSVKMLKINGDDLMKLLKIKPGPKIGTILDVLLCEVIEEPKLNNKKYLEKRSKELNELDLKELRAKARERIEERKMEDDQELKKEFWVK